MNQQARQKYILEKIKLDGVVNSASIAQDLSVSLITVRRDLKILAAQGLIELTHGGAINNELNILEYPMAIKMDILLGEKKSIANYRMSLVKPNSSIYLDTGSTTLLVAKKLIHIEGCVFYTNSLLIMNSLSKINGINLHCVPGKYRELSKGFIGLETVSYLSEYSFDICFMGTDAISNTGVISLPTEDDAFTKKAILKNSRISILVVDSSKFNRHALHSVGNISDFSYVVTNLDSDSEIFQELNMIKGNIISVKSL